MSVCFMVITKIFYDYNKYMLMMVHCPKIVPTILNILYPIIFFPFYVSDNLKFFINLYIYIFKKDICVNVFY